MGVALSGGVASLEWEVCHCGSGLVLSSLPLCLHMAMSRHDDNGLRMAVVMESLHSSRNPKTRSFTEPRSH